MWTISMLKENAKRALKSFYMVAVGASLIFLVLAGGTLSNLNKGNSASVNTKLADIAAESSGADTSSFNEFLDEYQNSFNGYMSPDQAEDIMQGFDEALTEAFGSISDADVEQIIAGFVIAVAVIFIVSLIIKVLYDLFVANPITVGHNRFYLDGRMGQASVTNVFSQFRSGVFGNTVKLMFAYDLRLWLWELLAVIPLVLTGYLCVNAFKGFDVNSSNLDDLLNVFGEAVGYISIGLILYCIFLIPKIVVTYSYTMVPYIIAENSNISSKRAFEISSHTMKGEKLHYFGLQLSFIGWYILAGLASSIVSAIAGQTLGGIATIAAMAFLTPYIYATNTEFYCCMREKAAASGIASPDELNGVFGAAVQNILYPDPSTFSAPYQPVDNSTSSSGTYPAYPQQEQKKPVDPFSGEMDSIDTIPQVPTEPEQPAQPKNDDFAMDDIFAEDRKNNDNDGPDIF